MNAQVRPLGPARRRDERLARTLAVAAFGVSGCLASEPTPLGVEQDEQTVDDKATAEERFARNLAARANTYCRCRPPIPPRFPHGDDKDAVEACVAQQAIQLFEEVLQPVTVKGPKPYVDVGQRRLLSEYLERRGVEEPNASPCDLGDWMEAVAHAAVGTKSSGSVATTPLVVADDRHPSTWSDIGFLAAPRLRNFALARAEPELELDHGGPNQVWLTGSNDLEQLKTYVHNEHFGGEFPLWDPDVCIVYRHGSHRFDVLDALHPKCQDAVLTDDYAGDDDVADDDWAIGFLVSYVYFSATGEAIYKPDVRNLPPDEAGSALSLGFRPFAYRGMLMTYGSDFFFTRDFGLRYDPRKGCEDLPRTSTVDYEPFDGMRRPLSTIYTATPGLHCRRNKDECAECSKLTAPASWCVPRSSGAY